MKERVAYLENGKSVTYDKCLIATGTTPSACVNVQSVTYDKCIIATGTTTSACVNVQLK